MPCSAERRRLMAGSVRLRPLVAAAVSFLVFATAAWAQQATEEPAGLSGHDDRQPIEVTSDELEVRDLEKVATFTGNVDAVQGDMTLTARVLDVHYGSDPGQAAAPESGVAGNNEIRKIVATGDVVVTSPREVAEGDYGVYDLQTRLITLTGNVVLTQDENVVRGDRLVVELDTGISRVLPKEDGGRVRALFVPEQNPAPAGAGG